MVAGPHPEKPFLLPATCLWTKFAFRIQISASSVHAQHQGIARHIFSNSRYSAERRAPAESVTEWTQGVPRQRASDRLNKRRDRQVGRVSSFWGVRSLVLAQGCAGNLETAPERLWLHWPSSEKPITTGLRFESNDPVSGAGIVAGSSPNLPPIFTEPARVVCLRLGWESGQVEHYSRRKAVAFQIQTVAPGISGGALA